MLVPCKINRLSDAELESFARDEFNEDEGEIDEALASIESWITSCPHLANTRKDREFLRFEYCYHFSHELHIYISTGFSIEDAITILSSLKQNMIYSTLLEPSCQIGLTIGILS